MSGTILAILSGVSMGVGGLAYRIGDRGRVLPVQLMTTMGLCGCLLFAFLARGEWAAFSPIAALLGVVSGVTQYATIRLLKEAMRRGPLAPPWCAISLGGFVPVIVFSFLFLNERPGAWQLASVLCSCIAIAAASLGQRGGGGRSSGVRQMALYGLLLISLLLTVGVLNILLKYALTLPGAHAGENLMQSNGRVLMFFAYAGIAISSATDVTLSRKWVFNRYAWFGSLVLTVGGLGAYLLILSILDLPAVTVFTLCNIVSILTVALGSVLIFGEKTSRSWYAMLALSLLAILLNR